MLKRAFLLLPLACLAACAVWAANDPMVGNWKLNWTKSTLFDEMKVADLGANKYGLDFGGGQLEKIVADGTDQPGMSGTTFALTPLSANQWTAVRKKNGRVQVKAIWTLSKDGNTLHDDFTGIGDNGETIHVVYVYQRHGGGSGFAADWVSVSEQSDGVYLLQVRPYEGDGLSIISPSQGVTRNVKFDGKDYPSEGSGVKSVSSGQRVNERTVDLTIKLEGKIVATQHITLSDDGNTLTMAMHAPGQSHSNVLVFDRQ